jgi:multidrug efflux pump subunit AcrB
MYKFNDFSTIEKETTSPVISKTNQQYQVYLQFDYIGSDKFARNYINEKVDNFKPLVPIGYAVSSGNTGIYWWGKQDKNQYWLLLLIVVMIFFICTVLFESLLQPFAVILTIPVGYIGIILTFYLFGLNFDQGGFAALVMLSGITVNAAIYILNDYNNLRRQNKERNLLDIKLYFKAFNYKIIPILLTVVSTVLGFVPFLNGEKQPFWFALAVGSIGGLLFSLLGIVFYLPLFLGIKNKKWSFNSHSVVIQ